MLVNCIHLSSRIDRHINFTRQAAEQGFDYRLWEGFADEKESKTNISKSHKQVIRFAKENKIEKICLAEDDLLFSCRYAYDYFIDNIPDNFDLYFGGLSGGYVDQATDEVTNFSGLFLYVVHERFYDIFLDADETINLDRALGTHKAVEEIAKKLGRMPVYKVCNPLVAKTINGWSDNHNSEMNLDVYWKPYKYLI